ncbi:Kelch repeat-containing protein [Polyangium aurulentum]|uniref:Kelch repeat-containing protein n=1 Tax=Polyangium aurulentum TaxID=2567896 RepID=UPI0010ADBE5E|nr:kelch repeat-containing protein [Polyangium aurulentum]UQA55244.1 hypothetical protein E8A73_028315 [Polyangium aurulentum]
MKISVFFAIALPIVATACSRSQPTPTPVPPTELAAPSPPPASAAPGPLSSPPPPSTPARGTCVVVAKLSPWRYGPSVTPLPGGDVLIAGGRQGDDSQFMTAVDRFDPKTRAIRPAAPLAEARSLHGAAVAGDGRVVVAGGRTTKAVEVYDPTANQWSKVGNLGRELVTPIVVALPSGNVLVAGGDLMWKGALEDKAFEWRTKAQKLVPIAPMPAGSSGALVVKLPDGRIGIGADPLNTMEEALGEPEILYDEKAGWLRGKVGDPVIEAIQKDASGGTLLRPTSHRGPALRLTDDGIQALDPKGGEWREVAKLERSQPGATAAMLDDDTALVAGGIDEEKSLVEICSIAP